jgi:hypothetical protein
MLKLTPIGEGVKILGLSILGSWSRSIELLLLLLLLVENF